MNYLIDTNICIYYMKGLYNLDQKLSSENCYISEITLAELKYGLANSERKAENRVVLDLFLSEVKILPIFNALDVYAEEKARLKSKGFPIEEFDLLIGASAVTNKMTLVTNNTKHFKRIANIQIENWTQVK